MAETIAMIQVQMNSINHQVLHSPLIELVSNFQVTPTILCFVFVSCVHSRVVEGSWEGIAGCAVHVDVHGECVCCGWMQCT